MSIHTDLSPAHEKKKKKPLDKNNEINNNVISKTASSQPVIALFPFFGWSMFCALLLYHALKQLILKELFTCLQWAAADYVREAGSMSVRPGPTVLPASCHVLII